MCRRTALRELLRLTQLNWKSEMMGMKPVGYDELNENVMHHLHEKRDYTLK